MKINYLMNKLPEIILGQTQGILCGCLVNIFIAEKINPLALAVQFIAADYLWKKTGPCLSKYSEGRLKVFLNGTIAFVGSVWVYKVLDHRFSTKYLITVNAAISIISFAVNRSKKRTWQYREF